MTILSHGKALNTSMGLPKIDWPAAVILAIAEGGTTNTSANWNGLRIVIDVPIAGKLFFLLFIFCPAYLNSSRWALCETLE